MIAGLFDLAHHALIAADYAEEHGDLMTAVNLRNGSFTETPCHELVLDPPGRLTFLRGRRDHNQALYSSRRHTSGGGWPGRGLCTDRYFLRGRRQRTFYEVSLLPNIYFMPPYLNGKGGGRG